MIQVDTHTAFWITAEPEMLSAAAVAEINLARRERRIIAISDKTLWELAMMIERKRIQAPLPMGPFLRQVEKSFTVLPLNADIAERSMMFSSAYPKDPADRIIGATALSYGIPLVTADEAIRNSNEVKCIW